MLSIERCRELLGKDCPSTDEEIKALIAHLYELAVIVIEATQAKELK